MLSFKTPLVRERWDYQGQQVFKNLLHSLSNAEITCSPGQKAVQESASVTDDYNNNYYIVVDW